MRLVLAQAGCVDTVTSQVVAGVTGQQLQEAGYRPDPPSHIQVGAYSKMIVLTFFH